MNIQSLPDSLKAIYPFTKSQSYYFKITGGHKMHYLDVGRGQPIIMVHGHPTWSFYYRNMILGLKDKFRCIAIDHIGCGLSGKPQDYPYLLKNHVDNLSELIEHLEIKDFHLMVHDWGGTIGMGIAERYVEYVNQIIVLNTAAFRSSKIPFRISLCRIPGIGELFIKGLNGFARFANIMAVVKKMSPTVKQGYLYPFNSWLNRLASHRFVKDIPLDSSHPSYEMLKHIENGLTKLKDKPMMICWGGRDFCFNDHFYEEWKCRFSNAQSYYFKDAGHYVLEDAGAAVLKLTKNFLKY